MNATFQKKHGGKRSGAGRPKNTGKFQEPTKLVRIPESLTQAIHGIIQNRGDLTIPLYSNKISAGFPSPADDHIEADIDLNEFLIKDRSSTFMLRVSGDSMRDLGISSGDILIVDRSITPVNGKIVIAVLDGELTVKQLKITEDEIYLMPANPDYNPIKVNEFQDMNIWGVVAHVIRSY